MSTPDAGLDDVATMDVYEDCSGQTWLIIVSADSVVCVFHPTKRWGPTMLRPGLSTLVVVGALACTQPDDATRPHSAADTGRTERSAQVALDRIRGRFALPERSVPSFGPARVELPERADEGFVLTDLASGAAVTVTLDEARDVEWALVDGYAVFPDAHASGADLLQTRGRVGHHLSRAGQRRPVRPGHQHLVAHQAHGRFAHGTDGQPVARRSRPAGRRQQISGTACGDTDDTECTDPDSCDAGGTCLDNHAASGAACGDQGADCHVDDECDGDGACTDNGFLDDGTECTDGLCELGDCLPEDQDTGAEPDGEGCGCQSTGGGSIAWVALAGLAFRRRRSGLGSHEWVC